MSSLLTRVIYIFVAFAIVTAIGFSIPALVQNSTTVMADEDDFDDDDDDDENLCPCPLEEYFKTQTRFAKAFGIFDPTTAGLLCQDSLNTTLLAAQNIGGCDYRIFAAAAGGTHDSNHCRAFVFGQNVDPCTFFNVAYLIDELTDDELAACREEIIRVAGSFEVPCD